MNENNSNENINNEVETKVEYVPKSKKSRKGDDGIYVQYRKPSVFSTILLVLIGILIGIVIMLLVYVVKTNKDLNIYNDNNDTVVEQPQEEEKVEDKKELDLALDGEFVKSLYTKIPMQIRGYEPYTSAKTTIEDISDNNKLLFTLRTLEKEYKYQVITDLTNIKPLLDNKMDFMYEYLKEVKKFEFETVKAKYKEIFGADKEVPLIDADTTLGYVYEYVPQDNCYYGHLYQGGGGGPFEYKNEIYSCEKNETRTEVYLYEKFIVLNRDETTSLSTTSDIYISRFYGQNQSHDETKIIDNLEYTYDEQTKEELWNNMTKDELFDKYWESAGKFKHTYKLDSAGNYYWYSSEQI